MAEFETFPKEIVWIPGAYGLWTHRRATKADERRRSLVRQLLYSPRPAKGTHFSLETLRGITEDKVRIRKQLAELPKPWE